MDFERAGLFDPEGFGVSHTLTLRAEGVLQSEHIVNGSTHGKIKKLLARAGELQPVAGGLN